jgi:uncharacterized protein YjdB
MLVYGNPVVVLTQPAGTTVSGIELRPPTAQLDVGDVFISEIWGDYTNGTSSELYLTNGEANYSSSDPNVATVDTNGIVTMISTGTAIISAACDGYNNQMTVTSIAPYISGLAGIITANGSFQLSFNASAGTTNVVLSSTNLLNWVPIAILFNTNGSVIFQDNATTNFPARFYRVLIQN